MSKPANVLIVDDCEDVLILFGRIFTQVGANARTAASALEAMDILNSSKREQFEFDLITLDIRMPEMNGRKLAREIRNSGYKGKIVAFTADTTGAGRSRPVNEGIDAYFGKQAFSKELAKALLDTTVALK